VTTASCPRRVQASWQLPHCTAPAVTAAILAQVRPSWHTKSQFPNKVVDFHVIFGTTFSITFGTLGNSMPSLMRS